MNDFHHILDHFSGETRVSTEEHSLFHDAVCYRKFARNAHGVWIITTELDEGGLADKVATEEHAVAYFIGVKVSGQLGAGEWGVFFDSDFKAEP
jgi:hypothetical protein